MAKNHVIYYEHNMSKRVAQEELGDARETKKRALGDRLHDVSETSYRRMAAAVDAALVENTQQPIILSVSDLGGDNSDDSYNYDLAFYPDARATALHALQRLDVTEGSEHGDLVAALYDINEDEDYDRTRVAVLAANDLPASLGRIERIYTQEYLAPFLYFQRCTVNSDTAYDDEDC